jgi:hypothetical protein
MVLALTAWLWAPTEAWAGKLENVKKAVKDKCNKEIPPDLQVSAAIRAYDCEPEQTVTIVGCKITCLKENDGNVVGK